MLLEWSDSLSVDHPDIDHDHKETIALLNAAWEARGAAFVDAWTQFTRHLEDHFGREEALMVKASFPAFEVHKAEHTRVLKIIEQLNIKVSAGDHEEARAHLREGVVPWFLEHRNTMDFVTARFVSAADARLQ